MLYKLTGSRQYQILQDLIYSFEKKGPSSHLWSMGVLSIVRSSGVFSLSSSPFKTWNVLRSSQWGITNVPQQRAWSSQDNQLDVALAEKWKLSTSLALSLFTGAFSVHQNRCESRLVFFFFYSTGKIPAVDYGVSTHLLASCYRSFRSGRAENARKRLSRLRYRLFLYFFLFPFALARDGHLAVCTFLRFATHFFFSRYALIARSCEQHHD